MGSRRQWFVEFMSPGTFIDETTEKPIEAPDPAMAMKMAKGIEERYGSKPYGFRFIQRLVADDVPDGEGGMLKVKPKTMQASGTHYIKGKLRTYDDVVRDADPNEDILQSNMRCNGWWVVCETRNSWRHTGIFDPDCLVVDEKGKVIERGDDPRWVAYRKKQEAARG